MMSYPSDGIIMADGQDVAMIEAQILDANDRFIGTATNMVKFSITSGSGEIYGVGNGDPACHESDKGTSRSAFHGRVRVIVNSMLNKPGTIKLMAESDGLTSDTISIQSKAPQNPIILL